jgi:hypothetical protein
MFMIALRLLFRFLESRPFGECLVGKGPGKLSRLNRERASGWDGFCGRRIFFCGSFFVFFLGVLGKTGVWMWFFDGEFVVGLWRFRGERMVVF